MEIAMPIFNKLPHSIEVEGVVYPIVTDFKAVLEYSRLVRESGIAEGDAAECGRLALRVFYLTVPPNAAAALEKLQGFLCCGEPVGEEPEESQPVIDFCQDYWRIWAGFKAAYGIDLGREDMHWWEFKYLLDELPDTTRIKNIMTIRELRPDPKNQESYEKLMRLKHHYRIRGLD